MIRPDDEGAGDFATSPHESFDNQHDDSTSDCGDGTALASMQVRASKCGCTLHELSDGFLVGRWGYSKIVPCLRSVGDLLRQIGGAA